MNDIDYDRRTLDSVTIPEELRRRGFKQQTCKKCNGNRWAPPVHGSKIVDFTRPCLDCNGRGYHWMPPLMK